MLEGVQGDECSALPMLDRRLERGYRMKTIELNNHVQMPAVGLGTFASEKGEFRDAIDTAIRAGYRGIDTAQMYGNEADIGAALTASGIPREEIFLTTKLYETSRSYEKAKRTIEQSLVDLQTEYIDLLLLHMPYEESLEMYRAMEEAYSDGKVRAIGVCNFRKERYLEFVEKCRVIPAVNQFETHVFQQNEELQRMLKHHGTLLTAWSPLAKGRKGVFHHPILKKVAEKHHKTVAQIMLRNLVQRDIAVIPKSIKPERIKENIDIFDFELDAGDMEQIATLDQNESLLEWTKDL